MYNENDPVIEKSKDISTGKTIIREINNPVSDQSKEPAENFHKTTLAQTPFTSILRTQQNTVTTPQESFAEALEKLSHTLSAELQDDGKEAYVMFYPKEKGVYSREEILKYLKSLGIVHGILEEAICKITDDCLYYEEVLIARETEPVNGKDGYYEFFFDINPPTKPIVLEDGTVDYNTLGKMELVVKGQLLAAYHKAIAGIDGKNIFGTVLSAINGKDLAPLNGNGFSCDDGISYLAASEGNVTLKGSTIKITPVFTVENLEAATGNLSFHGDVVVKGNVFANVTIDTTGSIMVNGHVEVASLLAGRDIILKNGMQGSGTGRIIAKGSVYAKFLEQTKVQADGDVQASAILNCDIKAGGCVIAAGSRGSIIGGTTTAAREINANTLGNRVGVKTTLIAGLERPFKNIMEELDASIKQCKSDLSDVENAIDRLTFQIKTKSSPALAQEKMLQTREKIRLNSLLKELESKKASVILIHDKNADSKVVVNGFAYAECTVIIHGITELVTSPVRNVNFTRKRNEIRVISNTLDTPIPKRLR